MMKRPREEIVNHFEYVPLDVISYLLEFVIADIPSICVLFLVCKIWNRLVSTYWKTKYPEWPFELVPRPPNVVTRKFAIMKKVNYDCFQNFVSYVYENNHDMYVKIPNPNVLELTVIENRRLYVIKMTVYLDYAALDITSDDLVSFDKVLPKMTMGTNILILQQKKGTFSFVGEKGHDEKNVKMISVNVALYVPAMPDFMIKIPLTLEETIQLQEFLKRDRAIILQYSRTGIRAVLHFFKDALEFGHTGDIFKSSMYSSKDIRNIFEYFWMLKLLNVNLQFNDRNDVILAIDMKDANFALKIYLSCITPV